MDDQTATTELATAGWPLRGSCPVCGSAEVIHVFFGLPAPGVMEQAPEWVRFAGCTIWPDAYDRQCEHCGHTWTADPGTPS
jgi:hypothetical protein